MRYKFYKKQFEIWKDWITILPTVEIKTNDLLYTQKNFSIEFHWLVFHARLLFLEGGDSNE